MKVSTFGPVLFFFFTFSVIIKEIIMDELLNSNRKNVNVIEDSSNIVYLNFF